MIEESAKLRFEIKHHIGLAKLKEGLGVRVEKSRYAETKKLLFPDLPTSDETASRPSGFCSVFLTVLTALRLESCLGRLVGKELPASTMKVGGRGRVFHAMILLVRLLKLMVAKLFYPRLKNVSSTHCSRLVLDAIGDHWRKQNFLGMYKALRLGELAILRHLFLLREPGVVLIH